MCWTTTFETSIPALPMQKLLSNTAHGRSIVEFGPYVLRCRQHCFAIVTRFFSPSMVFVARRGLHKTSDRVSSGSHWRTRWNTDPRRMVLGRTVSVVRAVVPYAEMAACSKPKSAVAIVFSAETARTFSPLVSEEREKFPRYLRPESRTCFRNDGLRPTSRPVTIASVIIRPVHSETPFSRRTTNKRYFARASFRVTFRSGQVRQSVCVFHTRYSVRDRVWFSRTLDSTRYIRYTGLKLYTNNQISSRIDRLPPCIYFEKQSDRIWSRCPPKRIGPAQNGRPVTFRATDALPD